jgi:hypothetical protein
MLVSIPDKKKQFIQTNRSDTLGNLWATFNCDLWTNLGKLRTTRLLKTVDGSTLTAMTDVPCAFKYYIENASNFTIFMLASPYVFAATKNHTAPVQFTSSYYSGSPSDISSVYSDMEYMVDSNNHGALYITGSGTTVHKFIAGSGWTNISAGTSSYKHIVCVYGLINSGTQKLYMTDQGGVISIDSNGTVNTLGNPYTLIFNNSGLQTQAYFMKAGSDRIWLGIGSSSAGSGLITKGQIYEWDGISNAPSVTHVIDAGAPISCVIKDDIPYVMDSNGRLLWWNGGTFKELARLPLDDKSLAGMFDIVPFVHYNGMSVVNGKINILVNGEGQNGLNFERCPSGIWEYDEKMGLYHKFSISNALVANGNTPNDWGHSKIASMGALTEIKPEDSSTSATGQFMVGASVYTAATGTVSYPAVFINDTYTSVSAYTATQRSGYFVTSKLESMEIQDVWQKIYIKYKPLQSSSSRIIAKYRTTQVAPLDNVVVTWTSTTTFTCSTATISGYTTGDEVEILGGAGAGLCAHIVTAIDNSGTTTVTIDESQNNTSGSGFARFQHWIKMGADISDQTSTWKNLSVAKAATWVQFKIYMLATREDEFEQLLSVSESHKPAN